MAEIVHDKIVYRDAREDDAAGIAGLFFSAYGAGYVHPEFYEPREIRRIIFDADSLVVVAEHEASKQLVGTAGVLFEMGAYSDLVGEFGRLVVHPEWRGQGIGHGLMHERLARVGGRLHMAFAEVRVPNSHSPRISQGHGFVPVGALPQKLIFGGKREHAGLMVQHFNDSLSLRKNHPRIIPEAHRLADNALRGVKLAPDVIVDDEATAYPRGETYDVEELTSQEYPALLRIERGRVRGREVFGPQRLQYGLFKLKVSRSHYIVAREGQRIVAALGYSKDDVEKHIRVFELIHSEEDAIRFLFEALAARCEAEDIMGVEVDVSAHASRLQRTLLEMGYLPCAYVPAMAFHHVERVDVIKMYRLIGDLLELEYDAPEPTLSVLEFVLAEFAAYKQLPGLARAMEGLDVCRGLTEEQTGRLLGEFEVRKLEAGARLFDEGEGAEQMFLILDGTAEVSIGGEPVGTVGPGESVGEVAFLSGTAHSASVAAESAMEIGLLKRSDLDTLVRRRPDIGAVVYRNMAEGLGAKLRRADASV